MEQYYTVLSLKAGNFPLFLVACLVPLAARGCLGVFAALLMSMR